MKNHCLTLTMGIAFAACGSTCWAQAMQPTANTMSASGSYIYSLDNSVVGIGSSTVPSVFPTPGDYGPYEDGFTWAGATWSTRVATGWSLTNTTTTTDVSGYLNLYGSVDRGQTSSTVMNNSDATISFTFTTTQPISYTANWYTTLFGPVFSTGTYGVYGTFSPYGNLPMSTLTPMSNSGTLLPGVHTISLVLDLDLVVPPSLAINDAIGMGFSLHTEVIPSPGVFAVLGVGGVMGMRRGRSPKGA